LEGRTVSHYRVLHKIGEGGMGEVYLAEDTSLDRKVALKFLPAYLHSDDVARKRFVREAKSAAAIDHPYICNIHEVSRTDDGQDFIVMEYVVGKTLTERLSEGPLTLTEALQLASEIAEGLEKAHNQGIVHRDLKPANIMITSEGHAKVMDFGLAKSLKAPEGVEEQVTAPLTQEGSTLGTLYYMSPEQIRAEPMDTRSDIFSYGVVLYEMLSGEHPFRHATQMATVNAILNEDPPSPTSHREELPRLLHRVLRRMLAKDPDERYQQTGELRRALERCRAELSVPTGLRGLSKALIKSARRPSAAIPLAVVVLTITILGYWWFDRAAKVRWAREVALPEIERLMETSWYDFTDAYQIAVRAQQFIPDDSRLSELMSKCSLKINITTEPPNARAYFKEYEDPNGPWEYLGETPIENASLPVGIFRWKFEKEGYETVFAAESTWDLMRGESFDFLSNNFSRVLDEIEKLPLGMARVAGSKTPLGGLEDFYIDKYEVTNRQYIDFIDRWR